MEKTQVKSAPLLVSTSKLCSTIGLYVGPCIVFSLITLACLLLAAVTDVRVPLLTPPVTCVPCTVVWCVLYSRVWCAYYRHRVFLSNLFEGPSQADRGRNHMIVRTTTTCGLGVLLHLKLLLLFRYPSFSQTCSLSIPCTYIHLLCAFQLKQFPPQHLGHWGPKDFAIVLEKLLRANRWHGVGS